MSDANITPFEASSSPDFGGPFRTVCDHFQQAIGKVDIDWEKKTLTFQVTGDHAVMNARIHVCEEDHILQVFINLPLLVANEKMRALVAEYVCRANWGLIVGSIRFDMRDSEMVYHFTHLMEDHKVGDRLLGRVFSTGLSTFDRYIPGIFQIVYGGHTPADACYLAEIDMHGNEEESGQSGASSVRDRKPPSRDGKTSKARKQAKKPHTPSGAENNPPPAPDEEDEF